MSCPDVNIKLLNDRIKIAATAIMAPLAAPIKVDAWAIYKRMKIACGIVCDAGDYKYLNVSPEEVMWITPDEGILYTVESNTSWSIEY